MIVNSRRFSKSIRNIIFDHPTGFTLIELIVVIAVIGTMFLVTLPRFRNTLLLDPEKKVSRFMIDTIKTLKENAFKEQKRYILHVGLDTNALWVSDETMDEAAVEQAVNQGYQLPNGIQLMDVEFTNGEKITSNQADIFFYPQGYSDKVLIHMEIDETEEITYLMEPFLSDIIIYRRYVGFDE